MRTRIASRCRALGAVAGVALVLAACGGDDQAGEGQADSNATATATAPDRSAPSAIAEGTTTLELSRRVSLILGAAGVEIVPVGAATESDAGIEIPVSGGELGVDPLAGRLRHDGGIRFTGGGQRVEATDLRLDTRTGAVTAEIGGVRVPLLSARFEPAELGPNGESVSLPGSSAALSDEAVAPLNDALGVDLLSGGLSIGELSVEARWR